MAATITVVEATGSTPDWDTITNCRFNTSDEHEPVLTYPIPIPAAGFNYSYWKSVAMNIADIGTQVGNIRHYSDGAIGWALGSAGVCNRGNVGLADGSYDQSTGTPGTTGDVMTDHAGIASVADIASDTSGSPFTVDDADHTSNERTKHIVMQVKVDTDATRGAQAAETFTWMYDEI